MVVSSSYTSPSKKTHGLPPQWRPRPKWSYVSASMGNVRSGAFVFGLNCDRVLDSETLIADLTLTHHLLVVSRGHQLRRLVNLAP